MDPILTAIDEALSRKNLSDAAASHLAVGNFALIKNMRASRSEDKRYSFQALQKLADVLDLECYFGPPRDIVGAPQPPASDPAELADIPLYNAGLAAGSGVANGDGEIVDYLAFRRDWLRTIGVAPSNAVMARIKGESMQPTIRSGDMVLIDTSKVEIQSRGHARKTSKPHVYAFVESGEARVKRIERVETDFYAVISDNDAEFPIEFKTGKALHDMHIIGRVMWWAHTDRG
ncbi:S24 family peptidase [Celeribacter baekdonensis]|uniref:S24 family peptidase n=1 Tax=Celeribacter baekdonensis TaxID=875171 RepID=UPI0030DB4EEF|tara:strand:+ start:33817 stop:34512 length:696 start_codon:yes stop_codon:yes gene_type:complete